jgi:hypothetical protein
VPPCRFKRLSEARIAVWSDDDASPVDRATSDMMEMVAARLEKAGATIDRYARPFSHLTEVADAYFQLLMPLLLGSYEPHELEVMSARSPNAKFVKLICAGRQQTYASMAQAKEVQARAISSWRAFFEAIRRLDLSGSTTGRFPTQSFTPIRRARIGGRGPPLPLLGSCYLERCARQLRISSGDGKANHLHFRRIAHGNPDRRPVSGGPNTDPRSRADGRSIRRLRTTSAI